MRYRVTHRTAYRYDQAVYESHNELRLSPLATPLQRVQRFEVRSEPRARMFSYKDWLGNVVHYFRSTTA
jgi:transglutaminase-like putative cysteine protease